MPKLVLLLEYDGTEYCGWQRQKNAISIQEKVEEAIEQILGQKLSIVAAGRTDAGVHARGQVAHINFKTPIKVPIDKIPFVLNSNLPKDIRIIQSDIADDEFHSRYKAIGREYSYTLTTNQSVFLNRFATYLRYVIDEELLFRTAEMFIGEYDFTNFSKYNEETKSYVCNVDFCRWEQVNEDILRLIIRANRFVYGMVRSIVGAMIDVARGKRTLDSLRESVEMKYKNILSPLSAPNGLVLERIYYAEKYQFFS